MADWRLLMQRLSVADHSLRLEWSELDSLVGGLPASATKHRSWWSGERTHVRAWRDAGFTIDGLALGRELTFVRIDRPERIVEGGVDPETGSSEQGAERDRDPVRTGDVLLITCVKTKLTEPAAAKDLYVSALFTRERRYAECRGVPWFILSAEHGLVAPDEWLSPYERYLPDTPTHYRVAWGSWVAERLDLLIGPLAGTVIEIHAGATYLDAVSGPLEAKGAHLLRPLLGLSMGQRLSWYDAQPESATPPIASGVPVNSATAATFVTMLLDRSNAVAPADFLETRGRGLKGPGLYSWWVDDPGAADLTQGLGLMIQPGLIYAGLAGATRWPSGRRSTNTLWTRIAGMHLGARHDFSTFRRTLGSILAAADGRESIDEGGLTDWMLRHLTVRTAGHHDPDALGRLEADVLKAMDPPLNLQGMPPTPVRSRITELRRTYGNA